MAIGQFLAGMAGQGAAKFMDYGIQDQFADSNAKDQLHYNLQLMEQQYRYNKSMFSKRYQMMADDLRAAGLNPILAASGGFSPGGSPSVGLSSQSQAPTYNAESIASSAKNFAEAKGVESEIAKRQNEIKEISANIRVKNEEVALKIAQTASERKKAGLIQAQEAKALQEVEESVQRVNYMQHQIWKIEQEVTLINKQILTESERVNLTKVQRAETEKKKELLEQEIRKYVAALMQLEKIGDVYKSDVGTALVVINEIIDSLGLGIVLPFLTRGLIRPGKGNTSETFNSKGNRVRTTITTPNK